MLSISEVEQCEQHVRRWLNEVVVGLNLCPFAKRPLLSDQILIVISEAQSVADILVTMDKEIQRLDDSEPSELETTLIVLPNYLQDFNAYLDMLELLTESPPWEGEYQVASFHPDYCFEDAEPGDASNLTNRSPYPIFHILREDSVEKALASYPNAEEIPQRNISTVESLSNSQVATLFPFLNR